MNPEIPEDHPRVKSLRERHRISEGLDQKIVTKTGLIAHGRGEAFDYLLGEKTNEPAKEAMRAGIALMMCAKHPVISVNGNIAALVPSELVDLSAAIPAPLEVNLFYREPGRLEAIERHLKAHGASVILGLDPTNSTTIKELSSNRRIVDARGIKVADVVLVPLEDGDRTEALVKEGKKVIAIDLNPLSRTALTADITIVDNVTRCLSKMVDIARSFEDLSVTELEEKWKKFDNRANISKMLDAIAKNLGEFAEKIL
ncbi:MAG: 4-phosphopantoate--beta-alanine ligase [Promethearchaeota archaeon]